MLRASDLWKQEEQQRTANMQAMRPVLSNLCSQIKAHAATNPDAPYMAYDVPTFVFGYPLYKHQEAVQYVKETLEEQGFKVWIAYNGTLLISWIKSGNKKPAAAAKSGDYRPFVYDEAAMEATMSRLR
jgi:uncharacterized protein YcgL (UPF0745 family)